MRNYETIYIMNPNLAEDDYKESVNKFNILIEKQKGVIIKTEEWGKQKLAYELKKFDTGTYVLVNYCGESGVSAELERSLKLDDRVLLYQTVKLADEVDPQELILKEKKVMKKSPAEEEQTLEKKEKIPDKVITPITEVKNGV